MPDQLQLRGGTTTEHNSFTGVSKEVTVDTTKKTLVVHDGSTAGGTPLMRESGGNAASSVSIGTGGNNAIHINNSQLVGIGTTSPTMASGGGLHLRGPSGGQTRLHMTTSGSGDTATDGFYIISLGAESGAASGEVMLMQVEDKALRFGTDNGEKMRITNDGEVGIGTTAPTGSLHVNAASSVDGPVFDSGGQNNTNHALLVRDSANNQLFRVNNNNRIGIGTSNPEALIHMKAADPVMRLHDTDTDRYSQIVGIDGNLRFDADNNNAQGSSHVAFRIDGTEEFRLDHNGNLGLGFSTISEARFKIKGANNSTTAFDDGVMVTSNNESVYKKYSWAGIKTQGGISFSEQTGGYGETMRITTTGKIGLHNQSPQGEIHVGAANNTNHEAIIILNNGGATGNEAGIEFRYESGTTPRAKIHVNSSDEVLRFSTGNSERMRIDSNGRIIVGGTSGGTYHQDGDDLNIYSSGNTGATIFSGTSNTGSLFFSDDNNDIHGQRRGAVQYDHSNNSLALWTNAGPRLTIDSDGDIGFGISNPQAKLEIAKASGGSNFDAINLRNAASDANSAVTLNFIKSTDGANTAARSYIRSTRSGSNSFLDIATSNTPAFRMTTDGKVGLGSNLSSIDAPLTVDRDVAQTASLNRSNQTMILKNSATNSTNNRTSLYFASYNSSNELSPSAIACTAGTNYQSALRFYTNGNGNGTGHLESYERMMLNHDGDLLVGTSSTSNAATGFKVTSAGKHLAILRGDSNTHLFLNKLAGNDGTVATFAIAASTKGSISMTSTATAFNTSSDYRLKENIVSISDGITRVKQLQPKKFNFIDDEKNTVVDGFLAHEVTSTVPEAITGAKDAVVTQAMVDNGEYEEERLGEIIPQQIDQSKLVPLLTAALQEAISKIETLEAKVAALEAA